MSILNVGMSGLNAAQMGLLTTGHNISNASTPGFNRQQVVQSSSSPVLVGTSGFIGQGTGVSTVARFYNSFLSNQVLNAQTTASSLSTYQAQITQVDNMLADPTAGLSPALQNFFSSVGDAAANPSSIPSRQSMLSGGQGLAASFQAIDQRLNDIRTGVNQQVSSEVISINAFVKQLADVNQRIIDAQATSGAQPANDLMDQRDQIINNLNKEVRVTTQTGSDGSFSVFFGTGEPLLVGTEITKLLAVPAPEDLSRMQVAVQDSNGRVTSVPDSVVNGGNLGGLLQFRAETLDQTQNSLGRIAAVIAGTFNAQHALGQDLTGTMGKAFFNTSQPAQLVLPNPNNLGSGNVIVTINSPADLTTSDYRLTVGTGNTLTLTRLSDNMTWTGGGATQALAMANLMTQLGPSPQGFSLAMNAGGVMNPNDSFLIQPTRTGARDISVALTDPSTLALAAPIRTAIGTSNAGTADISAGVVSSTTATLAASFDIKFESSSNSFVGFPAGALVDVGGTPYKITGPNMRVPYTNGANISVGGLGVKISGAPATLVDGDTFTIAPGGPSVGGGNLGTGAITALPAGSVTALSSLPSAPITLQYSKATNAFSGFPAGAIVTVNSTPSTTTTIASPATTVAFVAGATMSFNGISFAISGAPSDGDTFTVGPNPTGVSDNRNALLLGGLQTKTVMSGGTATFQDSYSQMVSEIGNKAREVSVSSTAQDTLVRQGQDAIQSVSGVNLDEEAANMMRYQQAYQAAAKVIGIAGKLFDTILAI